MSSRKQVLLIASCSVSCFLIGFLAGNRNVYSGSAQTDSKRSKLANQNSSNGKSISAAREGVQSLTVSPHELRLQLQKLLRQKLAGLPVDSELTQIALTLALRDPDTGMDFFKSEGLLSTSLGLKFLKELASHHPDKAKLLSVDFSLLSKERAALYEGCLASSPSLAAEMRAGVNTGTRTPYDDADVSHCIKSAGYSTMSKVFISDAMRAQIEQGASKTLIRPGSVAAAAERIAELPTSDVQQLAADHFQNSDLSDIRKTMMGGGPFIDILAKRSPELAAQWVTASLPVEIRGAAMYNVMKTWTMNDPEGALEFVKTYHCKPEEQIHLVSGIRNGAEGRDDELARECDLLLGELEKKLKHP